jgi:mannose-1-phosphate guanylyltransferase/MurNAc alpha-1-phosphate uridylyltransferase
VVRDKERADFEGGLQYAGAALMPWRDVQSLQPVPSGLYEMSWRAAERAGRLELVPTDAPVFDCGTPPDYLGANLAASGGASVVGAGAVVEGELVRSVVWPNGRVRPGERLVEAIRVGDDMTVDASRR